MQICFDLQKSEASLEPKKKLYRNIIKFPHGIPIQNSQKEFPHRVPTHNSHTGAIKWFNNGKHLQKLVNQLWIHECVEFTKLCKKYLRIYKTLVNVC